MSNNEEPKAEELTDEQKLQKARELDMERRKEFLAKYNQLVEEYGYQIQPRITLEAVRKQ